MAIKVTGNITPHFTIDEYAVANPKSEVIFSPRMLKHALLVEELRTTYKKVMNVTSWFRTESQNKKVGGVSNSNHLTGTAIDFYFNIKCTETVANNVAKMWKDICAANGEVGEAGWYPYWSPRGGMHLGIQSEAQKKANKGKFISWKGEKNGTLTYNYFKNL